MISFDLTEEQEMLRTMARDFFKDNVPKTLVKKMIEDENGYSPDLWQKMGELGWMGIALPEDYGGSGGSFLDLFILCEEMGRACLVDPFFATVVMGASLIDMAGSEKQKRDLLPNVVSGKLTLTLALTEPAAKYDPYFIETRAKQVNGGFILEGTKLFVENAHAADYIIVAARTDERKSGNEGLSLFLVDSRAKGVDCTLLKTLAGDKQCEVILKDVELSNDNLLGSINKGGKYLAGVLNKATVAKCGEMLGNAQQIMDMSVEYAKQRVQFGRPIGANQAIQWHCADMAIEIKGAKFLIYRTAWEIDKGLAGAYQVSAAKAWMGEAQYRACLRAHEICGALGFTEDYDLFLYTRRAKTQDLTLGDSQYHRALVADHLAW